MMQVVITVGQSSSKNPKNPKLDKVIQIQFFLIQATGSAGRRGTEDIDSNKRIGLENPK